MTERFFPFERRSHLRFKVPGARMDLLPVDPRTSAPNTPQGASLIDLSVGGLSFACRDPIQLGELFRFSLSLPGHEPIRLLGRVKWRGRGPNTPGYVHGVEFARYGTRPGENRPEHEKVLLAFEGTVLEPEAE
ncbi:MAG: PilZ domain-containing protein [Planctomycetes bacterium]|nr:PilZ domain-containing protein [Planctomycetota bacterium]